MSLLTVLTKTERSDPAIAWTLPAYLRDESVRWRNWKGLGLRRDIGGEGRTLHW